MKRIKDDSVFLNERLLDYDPIGGVRTYVSSETSKGKETMVVRYDFDDVSHEVDASKELAKDPNHWNEGVKKSWLHYGHIPDPILLIWHNMGVNINEPSELFAMVNKPEWSALKLTAKMHRASDESKLFIPFV